MGVGQDVVLSVGEILGRIGRSVERLRLTVRRGTGREVVPTNGGVRWCLSGIPMRSPQGRIGRRSGGSRRNTVRCTTGLND